MTNTINEKAAIAAITDALVTLTRAVELTKQADYGTSYVVHPLERALQEVKNVLTVVTEHD